MKEKGLRPDTARRRWLIGQTMFAEPYLPGDQQIAGWTDARTKQKTARGVVAVVVVGDGGWRKRKKRG